MIIFLRFEIEEKEIWKTLQKGEIRVDYPPMVNVKLKFFYNEIVTMKLFQLIKKLDKHKALMNKEIKGYSCSKQFILT